MLAQGVPARRYLPLTAALRRNNSQCRSSALDRRELGRHDLDARRDIAAVAASLVDVLLDHLRADLHAQVRGADLRGGKVNP